MANLVLHFRGAAMSLCLAVSILVTGCDRSGLNLAPVEGMVTYNGAPLANAGVLFAPPSGPAAMGTTDVEGKFTLMTANKPGALVGDHRVAISKSQTVATQIPGERLPRYDTNYLIPKKYASPLTSELTADVADDDNYFEFDLK